MHDRSFAVDYGKIAALIKRSYTENHYATLQSLCEIVALSVLNRYLPSTERFPTRRMRMQVGLK